MFHALINNKINHDFDLDVTYLDIEELNQAALRNTYDISKISFSLLSKVSASHWLLKSGSALGKACGPLIISKNLQSIDSNKDYHCLIPGRNTTANFLLSTLHPNIKNKEEILFSEIEPKLNQNEAELGLVIHETRFTYEANGFNKISDLGEEWEEKTGLPIPLGGIVANKRVDKHLIKEFESGIAKSIEYAYKNESEALEFCKSYAQEMDFEVMKSHIDLYVNEYSLSLGLDGKKTINFMLQKMKEMRQIEEIPTNLFF